MESLRTADQPAWLAGYRIDKDRKRMTDDSPLPRPQATTGQATKAAPVGWEPELEELRLRQAIARQMGGEERVARQHKGGRLTVRERIDQMLDPGTFKEIGSIAGKASYDDKGNITDFMPGNCVFGRGLVDGRPDGDGAGAKRVAYGSLAPASDGCGDDPLGSGQPVQQP